MPHAELLIAEQHPDLVLLDPDIGRGDGWLLLNQFAATHADHRDQRAGARRGYHSRARRGRGRLSAEAVSHRRAACTRARAAAPEQAVRPRASTSPMASPAIGTTTRLEQPAAPPPQRRDRRPAIAPGDRTSRFLFPMAKSNGCCATPTRSREEELRDISQLPLGQRLHAARQRKRITLVQAELETRPPVRMHYIQAMEEEKFSLLPRGPIAEELLRIYAAYIGIDATQALDEYRRLHFSHADRAAGRARRHGAGLAPAALGDLAGRGRAGAGGRLWRHLAV